MLLFHLEGAVRSVRRTPGLSTVMVVDMALGLAIWVISYAAVTSHTRDPLKDSSTLFHVDWGTAPGVDTTSLEGYQRVVAQAPHALLSYREAERLAEHPDVARSTKTFSSRLTVARGAARASSAARFCTRDLFGLFELRFRHGGPWSAAAEQGRAREIVLDHESNQRLFGGRNSVGRTLAIDGQPYRVTGVLADMSARVRAFDFTFSSEPAIYLPFEQFLPLGAAPDYVGRRPLEGGGVAELVTSGAKFVQLWVEIPDPAARARYAAFLRAQARVHGREAQVNRAMLVPLPSWLEANVPIASGFLLFEACAFLALLACSVNLSRLLIVKFQARAPELAVQRALGATRATVFAQHLLEALLLVVLAIALALLIAYVSLFGINAIMPDRPADFAMSFAGVAIGCGLGLGLGLLAAMPAAWRTCHAAPAAYLRLR